jgi:hypothetical protein
LVREDGLDLEGIAVEVVVAGGKEEGLGGIVGAAVGVGGESS